MTASVTEAIKATFSKYDVVHFHTEGPCAMIWLPKLFVKRCIAMVRGVCEIVETNGKNPIISRILAA